MDHKKLWKILKEMRVPPYPPPEKPGLVQNWKRSMPRLYVVTCLFNFYVEYSTRNARLDESQAGIKTARRNINNLRYADDTTLMTKELKSLLMRVKESEKAGLKLSIQKTKIMASSPITSWQINWGKV